MIDCVFVGWIGSHVTQESRVAEPLAPVERVNQKPVAAAFVAAVGFPVGLFSVAVGPLIDSWAMTIVGAILLLHTAQLAYRYWRGQTPEQALKEKQRKEMVRTAFQRKDSAFHIADNERGAVPRTGRTVNPAWQRCGNCRFGWNDGWGLKCRVNPPAVGRLGATNLPVGQAQPLVQPVAGQVRRRRIPMPFDPVRSRRALQNQRDASVGGLTQVGSLSC